MNAGFLAGKPSTNVLLVIVPLSVWLLFCTMQVTGDPTNSSQVAFIYQGGTREHYRGWKRLCENMLDAYTRKGFEVCGGRICCESMPLVGTPGLLNCPSA